MSPLTNKKEVSYTLIKPLAEIYKCIYNVQCKSTIFGFKPQRRGTYGHTVGHISTSVNQLSKLHYELESLSILDIHLKKKDCIYRYRSL